MPPVRQTSFAGGEISPTLYGRSDLERWHTTVRSCRNFMVLDHGSLANRPGMQFVAPVKDASVRVRLVPFVFSSGDSYVLEFGHYTLRFVHEGAVVLHGDTPGSRTPWHPGAALTAYEIPTPWSSDDIFQLWFAQLGDVITVTHKDYAPQEIRRYGHTSWTVSPLGLTRPASPTNVSATFEDQDGDASHLPKEWKWVVTTVDESGRESLPSAAYAPPGTGKAALYPDMPAKLTWTAVSGAAFYNVYRGRNDIYGFVGTCASNSFNDDGQSPAYSDVPPSGRDPFNAVNHYPALSCYHGQRRIFARSNAEPEKIWGSALGDFYSFDRSEPPNADDALDFVIAARRMDAVTGLIPLKSLIVLTRSAEYGVSGSQGATITPTDIQAPAHSHRGAEQFEPLIVGTTALYVQRGHSAIRDLAYDYAVDGYATSDVSILARHLFRGHSIVDWCYADSPYGIAWIVRDDGVLIGLTYNREHQVWAFHRHITKGWVESVASVPEVGEDAVYLVVRRVVNGQQVRFIERLASRIVENAADGVFLDSSISYDGRETGGATVVIYGAGGWEVGDVMTATSSEGRFSPSDIGDQVVLFPLSELEQRFQIIDYAGPTQVTVKAVTNPSSIEDAFAGEPISEWGIARKTFTGLSHLEGESVTVLADGGSSTNVPVSNGILDIGLPATLVRAGLPYRSEVELHDIVSQQAEIRMNPKSVVRVGVDVVDSRGFSVGEPGGTFRPWQQRGRDISRIPQLETGLYEVTVQSSWKSGGRVIVRQDEPLPITLTGVIRNVELGASR